MPDLDGVLAEVRNYEDLHAALRARAEALNVSRETLDYVSGLQSGYSAKLLGPKPMKHLGAKTLIPLLTTLGVKIVICEDAEALARLRHRLTPRQRNKAHSTATSKTA